MKYFHSYRGKILILCISIIFLFLVITLFGSWKIVQGQMRNNYSVSVLENMEIITDQVEAYYSQIRNSIEGLFGSISVQNYLEGKTSTSSLTRERLDSDVQLLYHNHPEFQSVQLYTAIDKTRARIRKEYPFYTYNFLELEAFLASVSLPEKVEYTDDCFCFFPCDEADTSTVPYFSATYIRSTKVNASQAVVAIKIGYDRLEQITGKLHYFDGEVLAILDQNDRPLFFNNTDYQKCMEILAMLDGRKDPFSGSVRNIQGYYVFSTQMNEYDYRLIRVIPVSAVFQSSRLFIQQMSIVAVFILIICFLFMHILSNHFMRPISQLIESMQHIGNGDMGTQISLKSNYTEISALIDHFNRMSLLINKLFNDTYRLKLSQRTAQFKELQAQINPHFLFNTLQTITYFSLQYDAHEITNITEALGNILRYSLNQNDILVPLSSELDIANQYLTIQKYRLTDKLTFTVYRDQALSSQLVPQMILQPLIENSIKHGLRSSGQVLNIRIHCSKENGMVSISVYDDGNGIDADKLAHIRSKLASRTEEFEKHIGLLNCSNRLYYIFGENAGLIVESEKNVFTQITIMIPAGG